MCDCQQGDKSSRKNPFFSLVEYICSAACCFLVPLLLQEADPFLSLSLSDISLAKRHLFAPKRHNRLRIIDIHTHEFFCIFELLLSPYEKMVSIIGTHTFRGSYRSRREEDHSQFLRRNASNCRGRCFCLHFDEEQSSHCDIAPSYNEESFSRHE